MIIEIVLIGVVVWLLISRWKRNDMIKLSKQLGNAYPTLPIVGHAYMFFGDDEDRMKVIQKIGVESYMHDGLLALWQGSRLYINVSDGEVAELVLKSCLDKDDVMKCSRLLTGNGSVFAAVPIWRPRRKVLAPTFSAKNLASFEDIFATQSRVMVDQMMEAAGKGTFSIWKYVSTYTMDSVCESTLGVKVHVQKQSDRSFIEAFEEICKLDAARIFQFWLHNDTVYRLTPYYKRHTECRTKIYEFITNIIKEKRKHIKEENNKMKEQGDEPSRKSFLELLIEATGDQGYTDLELREETLVLVLAGTDTSAVGTSFTAVMLSRYPDVQEKVYQELKEVFGDDDRPITLEDLSRLKYLEAVVRETMRLYPPVPIIVRKVTSDLVLPSKGVTLVKGCGLAVNIWAINRNPKHWGNDAMEFRPERFLDSSVKSNAFMVFSHGPRACLGYQYAMMSMKTAVASVVRRYRLLPAGPAPHHTHHPLRTKFDVMMKSVDNFPIQIELRG